jgi:hypothetical protein
MGLQLLLQQLWFRWLGSDGLVPMAWLRRQWLQGLRLLQLRRQCCGARVARASNRIIVIEPQLDAALTPALTSPTLIALSPTMRSQAPTPKAPYLMAVLKSPRTQGAQARVPTSSDPMARHRFICECSGSGFTILES